MPKLHLGCGSKKLAGYVHIDLADYPHIDHKHDVKSLPMFADNSVDLIYASHVLEYFDRCCPTPDGSLEVTDVLKEWRRILKPDGILRLAVPDFEKLVKLYLTYHDLEPKRGILGPLYGHWPISGTDKLVSHKTVYDFLSLSGVLKRAGFYMIEEWDWQEVFVGENAGFDDYSQAYYPFDKVNGLQTSLNVEAQKFVEAGE